MRLLKHMEAHMAGLFRVVFGFAILVAILFFVYLVVRLVDKAKEYVDTHWFSTLLPRR